VRRIAFQAAISCVIVPLTRYYDPFYSVWVLNLSVSAGESKAWETEQLTICSDQESGLRAVIALDDSTLGPGLGGVRWQAYPNQQAAVDEARRLARVMTLKNACADLPYGGAKSVIVKNAAGGSDDSDTHRQAQLEAFGRFVHRLGGAYIPGVDMGTSVEDLAVIGQVTPVSCDHEDPSPWTALGVFAGIGAALSGAGIGLPGAHVVVQGTGHVGADLARRLAEAGCRVSVADIDPIRAHNVAKDVGGRVVAPDAAVTTLCDVLAPCATARVIDRSNVDALRCRIVAGGANDVLATPDVAHVLAERGIVYVPDFVVNAGGVIHIHALRSAWGPDKLEGSLLAIGDRVAALLRQSERTGLTPLSVAEEMASHRLGRSIALPA
jgi:leucine dehydrogenase